MRMIALAPVFALLFVSSAVGQEISLLPWPDSIVIIPGKLRINKDLGVSTPSTDTLYLKAVNRFYHSLNRKTSAFFNTAYIKPGMPGAISVKPGKAVEYKIGTNESYTLNIDANGVSLESETTIGALRGMETLLQLATKDDQGYYFPYVSIIDKPRFPWRGLMIDVARHFIPMNVLKRNIDAMAAVKLNVLHLHLTDDEGFRIESKLYPKLHQLGSNGNYFTQDEMKSLVNYARERGIMVVPEFDLPGHSKSWFAGYPELASTAGTYIPGPRFDAAGKSIAEVVSMMNTAPTATLDPTKEAVYTFLYRFLGEMKTIFPSGYVHIGADENNGVAWKQNPTIVAFMQKNKIADVKALEQYFVRRMHSLVSKQKYKLIVWEEAFAADLPANVIVQKWRPEMAMMASPVSTNNILKQGNDVLLSTGFYLDHHLPAHSYYLNPALSQLKGLDTLKGKLMGGEAAQWTEIADRNNIEGRIWVNAAAIAERLWSSSKKNDINDLYTRLKVLSLQLDAQGLGHISGYERALRTMTGSMDISNVRSLTDVLTPVKGYKRIAARMTKTGSALLPEAPLSTVADILPMNSFIKRDFRNYVSAYLANPNKETALPVRDHLEKWALLSKWDDHGNIALREVSKHAVSLAELSSAALESIDLRAKGTDVSEEWRKAKMEMLKKASVPVAETEIDVLAELQALITGKLAPEPLSFPLF